ncbi:MAG: alpha/beta hydrolase [Anaerolineales bacterium]|nr:alpha/beta hydrolase [Anaerolineales bacterium]
MKMIDTRVLSRTGPPFLFIHANGYPPQAYQSFLAHFLDKYSVMTLSLRPFILGSDPTELQDWRDFRDDYLKFIDDQEFIGGISDSNKADNQVIGVGHSVGAMTNLMAAIERPNLFKALILFEPVLFPPWQGSMKRVMAPFKLLRKIHPLIRATLKRKVNFPSQEKMFMNYRAKPIFQRLSDDVLRDYVSGLANENQDGTISLRYSPEWEARIYETGGLADDYVWKNLPRVTCPVLILRGKKSDTLKPMVVQRLIKDLPNGQYHTEPGTGHLLPLEIPDRAASLVTQYLEHL